MTHDISFARSLTLSLTHSLSPPHLLTNLAAAVVEEPTTCSAASSRLRVRQLPLPHFSSQKGQGSRRRSDVSLRRPPPGLLHLIRSKTPVTYMRLRQCGDGYVLESPFKGGPVGGGGGAIVAGNAHKSKPTRCTLKGMR